MGATIIDAHGHFWQPTKDSADVSGGALSPKELVDLMDAGGVQSLVQITRLANGYQHEASFAGAQAYPGRFWVLARIAPDLGPSGAESLPGLVSRPSFSGVRLYERWDRQWLADQPVKPLLRRIEEMKIPLAVYAPGQERHLGALAEACPTLPIVIDHAGAVIFEGTPPSWRLGGWSAVMELRRHQNVFLKLSGLPEATSERPPYRRAQELARDAIEMWGPARVLWGSNYPPSQTAGSYGDMIEFISAVVEDLPDAARERVLAGTATALFQPRSHA